MKRFWALAGLALCGSVSASEPEGIRKLDPAWKEMEHRVGKLLGQADQRKLLDMAYAQVAVDACPGLAIDAKGFEHAFAGMAGKGQRTPTEQWRFENEMMVDFGVYTGLVLAESFLDKPVFCEAVERIRQKAGGPSHFWLPR